MGFESFWFRSMIGRGDIPAHRVALVARDASLALFEIDGIAGQVPVHEAMAPRMEIEPLLPDRGARKDEWAKRAVEGRSNRILADDSFVRTGVPEAQRDDGSQADLLRADLAG